MAYLTLYGLQWSETTKRNHHEVASNLRIWAVSKMIYQRLFLEVMIFVGLYRRMSLCLEFKQLCISG